MKKLILLSALLVTSLAGCNGHRHTVDYVAETPATCLDDGVMEHYACSACDQLFDMDLNPVEHSDLIIAKHHITTFVEGFAAGCVEDGQYAHFKCNHCGKLFSDEDGEHEITIDDITIASNGSHVITKVDAVAATCTSSGNIEYYVCEACDAYFSDEASQHEITIDDTIIESEGHDLEFVPSTKNSCDEAGNIEHYYCDKCEKHFSDPAGLNELTDNSWIIEAGHKLTYIEAREATFKEAGVKVSHYHCEICLNNYLDIDATELITEEVFAPAYPKSFDFETDAHPYLDVTVGEESVNEDAYTRGKKSLEVKSNASGQIKVALDKVWLEKIFAYNGAEVLYFDIKAEKTAQDFYYESLGNQYGVVRYETQITDVEYGINTYWKTVSFTKDMFADLTDDSVIIRVDNSVDNTIYIDNIRVGEVSTALSLESHAVQKINGNDNYIKNKTNEKVDLLVNGANTTIDFSDAYHTDGNVSLHLKSTQATQVNVYIPTSMYEAAKGSGIMFDVFIPNADTMHIYPSDNIVPRPYINPEQFGKWTTYYLEQEDIQHYAESGWARIWGNRIANNFEFYIDNIRIATDYGMDFENQTILKDSYEYSDYTSLITVDRRNINVITDEQSYSGSYSLRIEAAENYVRGFGINNTLYNAIPSTGGIKFYIYAEAETNLLPDGSKNYYIDYVGTWKEIIMSKSEISGTANDHWVFLVCNQTTVWIDSISIVTNI